MDLTSCKQQEGESTTHWVRRVKEMIHSSDKMDAGSAVLMFEKNYRFEPLKQKLGRLKRDCNDMGQLMAALVKYADSDSTKDHVSDEEKQGRERRTAMARVTSITRQIKEVISVRRTVTGSLWPMPMCGVTIRDIRVSRLGLVGQAHLLSSYSMSPASDTAPGSAPPHTYGRIARS